MTANTATSFAPVHFSQLKAMAVSPLHFRHGIDNPRPDTRTFGLGRAIHQAILEREAFECGSMVCEIDRASATWKRFEELLQSDVDPIVVAAGNRNAKAYKEAADGASVPVLLAKEWEQIAPILEATKQGVSIITRREYETASRIADAVHAHPAAAQLLHNGQAEIPIEWVDKCTGIACAGRIDYLGAEVVEIKSAARIDPRSFGRQCAALYYHAQIAWYSDAVSPPSRPGSIIAVESSPPYDVVVYTVPAEVLASGRKLYREWMTKLSWCLDLGRWPGISSDVVDLNFPVWALGIDDVELTLGGESI